MNDYEKLRDRVSIDQEKEFMIHPGALSVSEQNLLKEIYDQAAPKNRNKVISYFEPGEYLLEDTCASCKNETAIKITSKFDLAKYLFHDQKKKTKTLCTDCDNQLTEEKIQQEKQKRYAKDYEYLVTKVFCPGEKYKEKFTAEFTSDEASYITYIIKNLGEDTVSRLAQSLNEEEYKKTPYYAFINWAPKYISKFYCKECGRFMPAPNLHVMLNDKYKGIELTHYAEAVTLLCDECIKKCNNENS